MTTCKSVPFLFLLLAAPFAASAADVIAPDGFTMLNIIPSGADANVSARDAIEYVERTGCPHCLYSLTLHPQGRPAMKTVDAAVAQYRAWAAKLAGTPVRPGILLQAIIGHWTNDLADKDTEPWQRQINVLGKVTRYCPLDPGYQAYIREVGRKLAACHPSVILSDDDVRAFSPEAECFCPLHTAEYNRRMGTKLSPEEYRRLIAAAKADSPAHRLFVTLQCESVVRVCRLIREGIDAVDPSIPSGVCEPGWAWSRKQVPDYAKAIAGKGQTPFLRLGNGCYYEHTPKEEVGYLTLQTLAEAERLKDAGALMLDEGDTWPQNLWSKSSAAFHAKLVTAAFAGLKGSKIWQVNAHKGPYPVTRHYTDVMAEHRGLYGAVSAAVRGSVLTGLLLPCHPEFPQGPVYPRRHEVPFDEGMAKSFCTWFGVPFAPTYAFDRDGIYAIGGASAVERFTDAQLKAMLSKKAIVDGTAAEALAKRGFGDLIGVTVRTDNPLVTGEYNEMAGTHMNYPKSSRPPVFRAAAGAETLASLIWRESSYVKAFERVAPSAVLYRNALGGTVVAMSWKIGLHPAYAYGSARHAFAIGLLDRLAGRPFDNICANDQNTVALARRTPGGEDLVFVQNINFDGMRRLLLRRGAAPASVEVMDDHGNWTIPRFSWSDGTLTVEKAVPFYETAILRIR